MGLQLWNGADGGDLAERLKSWWNGADVHDRVVVVGLSDGQLQMLEQKLGTEAAGVYRGSSGIAVEWLPRSDIEFQQRQQKEHHELLLILQEALIKIADTDTDLASRLAARVYVNLKTDPNGQRRYDGLLHRFTGVLHRRPKEPVETAPPLASENS
ncbi:MAG: hypothetical protein C7B45_08690 [Sulfobacillus acidophilus]|uniref:Uncharacterized protein n=1 Tax=Sulfobacillus acidophilus TaxID=53633 RepID=A0A2T2WI88_9FIRM|nr:MAG: hypothetical protein C7B45_08690 [Sulfobacillus acidophilus]